MIKKYRKIYVAVLFCLIGFTTLAFFQNCSKYKSTEDLASASTIGSTIRLPISNSPTGLLSAGFTLAQINQEFIARSSNNVYSPSLIRQNGKIIMYYGGWDTINQQHDAIYRTECPESVGACSPGRMVIDSVSTGYEHINDGSVIQLSSSKYFMAVTAVKAGESGFDLKANKVYYTTSSDGVNWAPLTLLASDIWMPSVTVNEKKEVLVFANSNVNGVIIQYNLGVNADYAQQPQRQEVQTPKSYLNVEVRYKADSKTYEILAEQNGISPNQIDYLQSQDGLKWNLVQDGLIRPHVGQITVRSPAFHPDTISVVYYAETNDPGSTRNKIWSMQWTPPQPKPVPCQLDGVIVGHGLSQTFYSIRVSAANASYNGSCEGNSLKRTCSNGVLSGSANYSFSSCNKPSTQVCTAPVETQKYITGSQDYFKKAADIPAVSPQAKECLSRTALAIVDLEKQKWPCVATSSTNNYVKTCVEFIEAKIKAVTCTAPDATQAYVTNSLIYFKEAMNSTNATAKAQATECYNKAKPAVDILKEQKWPCEGSASTNDYVKVCVSLVEAQLHPPEPVCTAPEATQYYISTSLTYFSGQFSASAAQQKASACRTETEAAIEDLRQNSWACERAVNVSNKVKACIDEIEVLNRPTQPVICASQDVQNEIRSSLAYFGGSFNVPEAKNKAEECRGRVQEILGILEQQSWPCASANTTLEYARTCTQLVQEWLKPKACVAPSETQSYITSSLAFFEGSMNHLYAGPTARACYNQIQASITNLQQSQWLCESANQVSAAVQSCVNNVTNLVNEPHTAEQCYLYRYQDICQASANYCKNPRAHYTNHGMSEGRIWGCQ